MHTPHKDAAGAGNHGDGPVPAAPAGPEDALAQAAHEMLTTPWAGGAATVAGLLASVRARHGARYAQIEQDVHTGVWYAIEHPGAPDYYPLHLVVTFTLAELAAKLDAEGTAP